MTTSRRDFLGALLCASGALATGCRNAELGKTATNPSTPLVTNFNDSGLPRLTEGKTLLISLISSTAIPHLEGSLPVQIEPEAFGGQQLNEPQPLSFYPDKSDHRVLRTILSAPLDVVTGNQPLRVFTREGGSDEQLWDFPYSIERGTYREATLTLDKDFSSPTSEIINRQRQDFAEMLEVLKLRTQRRWSKPFAMPVLQGDLDNFGVRRTVNGTKRYRHRGLDLHAQMGTPVRAVNDGTIVLSTEQWTAGQSICIDHGGGLFSKYAHLSRRHVIKGDEVKRNQVIALSGDSGGQKAPPHLHLDIIINGTHVEPKNFMLTAAQLLAVEEKSRGSAQSG